MRIHTNTRRYRKYAVICAFFGVFVVIIASNSWLAVPVGLVFAALTVFLVRGSRARAPQIVIDANGLGGAELPRTIPWDEIAQLERFNRSARYSKVHFLRVVPREGKPFEISLSNLLMPPDEIVAAIQRFHPVD